MMPDRRGLVWMGRSGTLGTGVEKEYACARVLFGSSGLDGEEFYGGK